MDHSTFEFDEAASREEAAIYEGYLELGVGSTGVEQWEFDRWIEYKEDLARSASRYAGGGGAPYPRPSQRYALREGEIVDEWEEDEEAPFDSITNRQAWYVVATVFIIVLIAAAWFIFITVRDHNGGLDRYPTDRVEMQGD